MMTRCSKPIEIPEAGFNAMLVAVCLIFSQNVNHLISCVIHCFKM